MMSLTGRNIQKIKRLLKLNSPIRLKIKEAIDYVCKHFNNNNGELNEDFIYPTDFETSEKWLEQFLNVRFDEFGPYEDAVLKEKSIINHSILSPLMNSGLISPKIIVDKTIEYYHL